MNAKCNFQGLIALTPGTCLMQVRTITNVHRVLAQRSSNSGFKRLSKDALNNF